MTSIREVLAANLKENRRKLGLTQEKLAELANVSTHYIAMIETCNKYPKPEMLERLAKALGIEPHQLFSADTSPDNPLEHLRQSIRSDIAQVVIDIMQTVKDTVKETLLEDFSGQSKPHRKQKKT